MTESHTPALLTPEEGLEAIRALPHESTVLLDFDLTLFLINSTETYLDQLPAPLKGLIELDAKILTKGMGDRQAVHDWVRVVLATLLCPWLPLFWRRVAPGLAEAHLNRPLADALAARPDLEIVLVSIGFEGLISPVLKHMPVSHQGLIACGWLAGREQRQRGKLDLVCQALGKDRVSQSVVITDSNHDIPLLEAAGTPIWIKWPEARPLPAREH